jgi:hypothetical protein
MQEPTPAITQPTAHTQATPPGGGATPAAPAPKGLVAKVTDRARGTWNGICRRLPGGKPAASPATGPTTTC